LAFQANNPGSNPGDRINKNAAARQTLIKMAEIFLIVHSFVQGVGYRAFVKSVAGRMHISGAVKNATDGSVLIAASGNDADLNRFIHAIDVSMPHGPEVKSIETFASPPKTFELAYEFSGKDEFKILR
jgi:acylphosphatase